MYTVYILRCADSSLYIGYTRDLATRIRAHENGRRCVYTAARRPVILVYQEAFKTQVAASARERQLKKWTIAKKEALIQRDMKSVHRLAVRRVYERRRR